MIEKHLSYKVDRTRGVCLLRWLAPREMTLNRLQKEASKHSFIAQPHTDVVVLLTATLPLKGRDF